MGRLFGTDGVRGLANKELDCILAYKLGQAGAFVLTKEKKSIPKILVGRDTRISGDMLESALVAGICSVGATAIEIGIIPTPAIAYLTRFYNADAGIVISASHNPMEYNGIKIFNSSGYKLRDELEDEIESIILHNAETIPLPTGDKIGRKIRKGEAYKDYISFLKSTVSVSLKGFRVALDCANGASSKIAPLLFSELEAEVLPIHNMPDGTNINYHCGSTDTRSLQEYVIKSKADIGLAFDGDADRLIAVDEKGNMIDGDQIMVMCALDMKKRGVLKKNTVVATIMSNLGFDIALRNAGCAFEKTTVGDRYVLEKMLEKGYNIGGEQSGHIIFLDYNTTGDGMITALQLMSVMKRSGKKLSELGNTMKRLPQVLVNVKVEEDKKQLYLKNEVIQDEIRNMEETLAGRGRVLIRPSGTEPLIRIMIEGEDQAKIEGYANELAELLKKRLNN